MHFAILGGTAFVGRYVAEQALARGHRVTLFHRGLSDPSAFPGVEWIAGDRDRDEDLQRLSGRGFDAVIDTSGYEVKSVRQAVRSTAHPDLSYIFVSSIS